MNLCPSQTWMNTRWFGTFPVGQPVLPLLSGADLPGQVVINPCLPAFPLQTWLWLPSFPTPSGPVPAIHPNSSICPQPHFPTPTSPGRTPSGFFLPQTFYLAPHVTAAPKHFNSVPQLAEFEPHTEPHPTLQPTSLRTGFGVVACPNTFPSLNRAQTPQYLHTPDEPAGVACPSPLRTPTLPFPGLNSLSQRHFPSCQDNLAHMYLLYMPLDNMYI